MKNIKRKMKKIGTQGLQWYAVFSNHEYKEFSSKEDAIKADALFVVEDIYKGFEQADYWWKLSDFKFYNNIAEEITLSEGKWNIIKINEISRKSYVFEVEFTFQDPLKELRKHKFSPNASGYDRFCKIFEALEYLKIRASFNSWKEYDLQNQNEYLRSQILLLKQEIENIKNHK